MESQKAFSIRAKRRLFAFVRFAPKAPEVLVPDKDVLHSPPQLDDDKGTVHLEGLQTNFVSSLLMPSCQDAS